MTILPCFSRKKILKVHQIRDKLSGKSNEIFSERIFPPRFAVSFFNQLKQHFRGIDSDASREVDPGWKTGIDFNEVDPLLIHDTLQLERSSPLRLSAEVLTKEIELLIPDGDRGPNFSDMGGQLLLDGHAAYQLPFGIGKTGSGSAPVR